MRLHFEKQAQPALWDSPEPLCQPPARTARLAGRRLFRKIMCRPLLRCKAAKHPESLLESFGKLASNRGDVRLSLHRSMNLSTATPFFPRTAHALRAGMGHAAQPERGGGPVCRRRPGASQPRPPKPTHPAALPHTTPAPAPAPRYAASDLERAFSYMDRSGDARISREEAAAFRGVAKNFDRADTDLDGFLSREEFDTAMNYVKPK